MVIFGNKLIHQNCFSFVRINSLNTDNITKVEYYCVLNNTWIASKILDLSVDNTEIEYKQSLKHNRPSIIGRSATINTTLGYNNFESEFPKPPNENNKGLQGNDASSQKSKGEMLCRIWLSEDSTDKNPLISPWKCSGTMKFIHLECLKEWLASK